MIITVPADGSSAKRRARLSLDRDDVRDVVVAVRSGNPRALGRLISWIENASPALPMIMKELTPDTGTSARRRSDGCAWGGQVDHGDLRSSARFGRVASGSAYWPWTRVRPSPAERSLGIGFECRNTLSITTSISGRWRPGVISAGLRSPRRRRCGHSTLQVSTL